MVIETRRAGNLEVRSFGEDAARIPRPGAWSSATGINVTLESASGMPAFGRAMRLVAGIIGSLSPMRTFEGRGGDRRERDDDPLARLLESPVLGMSVFDWGYDVAMALEATENAYLYKVKDAKGVVRELRPIPPGYVSGRIVRGRKVFAIAASGRPELDESAVLHIRGQTVDGGPFGVSRITQHRDPLAAQAAALEFEGRYFRNDARPGVAFVFPVGVSQKTAKTYKAEIEEEYGGVSNSWRPFIVGGGVDVKPIPVSLEDSQYVEGRRFGLEDAGRIMDVDPVLLGAPGKASDVMPAFLTFGLGPRLRRIEEAFNADPDLYGLTPLYPSFPVDPLSFSDPLTRARTQHAQIQDGTLLVDEARADNGRPPLPDGIGQIPQIVPVGGSPAGVPLAQEPATP